MAGELEQRQVDRLQRPDELIDGLAQFADRRIERHRHDKPERAKRSSDSFRIVPRIGQRTRMGVSSDANDQCSSILWLRRGIAASSEQ